MAVYSMTNPVAGAGSLGAARPGTLGCVGPTRIRSNNPDPCRRRAPTRSCHPVKGSGKFDERRRTKKEVDVRFRVGTMNVGTMRGRSAEVYETADRRILDICFLQETRWKGVDSVEYPKQSRTQVRWSEGKGSAYKVFWSGNAEGTGGVGILLAKKWIDNDF